MLNIVKRLEQIAQEMQQAQAQATQKSLLDQAGQLAGTPMMDPQKNPQLAAEMQQQMMADEQAPPPEE